MLGQSATPEAVANIRKELGLDRPAYVRYFDWLGGILAGRSSATAGEPAGRSPTMIGQRLANTLFLASAAAIVAVPLAIMLGLLAARYRETLFDKADLDRHPVGDLVAGILHRLSPDRRSSP